MWKDLGVNLWMNWESLYIRSCVLFCARWCMPSCGMNPFTFSWSFLYLMHSSCSLVQVLFPKIWRLEHNLSCFYLFRLKYWHEWRNEWMNTAAWLQPCYVHWWILGEYIKCSGNGFIIQFSLWGWSQELSCTFIFIYFLFYSVIRFILV